jgi:hypothetical protein
VKKRAARFSINGRSIYVAPPLLIAASTRGSLEALFLLKLAHGLHSSWIPGPATRKRPDAELGRGAFFMPQFKQFYAAILWHSSAQVLHAAPIALHSATSGNLSHSFLQASQIAATVFAIVGVKGELTDERLSNAAQPAIVSNVAFVQAAMLVSSMDSMPKQ